MHRTRTRTGTSRRRRIQHKYVKCPECSWCLLNNPCQSQITDMITTTPALRCCAVTMGKGCSHVSKGKRYLLQSSPGGKAACHISLAPTSLHWYYTFWRIYLIRLTGPNNSSNIDCVQVCSSRSRLPSGLPTARSPRVNMLGNEIWAQ